MSEDFIELTEDEFHDRYTLRLNHFDPSSGWNIDETGGCLFGFNALFGVFCIGEALTL